DWSVGVARHDEDQAACLVVQQPPTCRLLPGGEFRALEPFLEEGEGLSRLLTLAKPLLGHCQEKPRVGIAALALGLDRLPDCADRLFQAAGAIQRTAEEGEGLGAAL